MNVVKIEPSVITREFNAPREFVSSEYLTGIVEPRILGYQIKF